jgi:hypothetical protein
MNTLACKVCFATHLILINLVLCWYMCMYYECFKWYFNVKNFWSLIFLFQSKNLLIILLIELPSYQLTSGNKYYTLLLSVIYTIKNGIFIWEWKDAYKPLDVIKTLEWPSTILFYSSSSDVVSLYDVIKKTSSYWCRWLVYTEIVFPKKRFEFNSSIVCLECDSTSVVVAFKNNTVILLELHNKWLAVFMISYFHRKIADKLVDVDSML